MTAIAEFDKDSLSGDEDPEDDVCLSFPIPPWKGLTGCFIALLGVAGLFRAWVLSGRGSKQSGEHRIDLFLDCGTTGMV